VTYSDIGCLVVSCNGASFNVKAHAEASDEGGTICVFDQSGKVISDDSNGCPASVDCKEEVSCRTTGGGTLYPGTSDSSCITVNTVIIPATGGGVGLPIDHISHGGQLGAPFSEATCPPVLGNICIRGQWQHNRHYAGRGNKREEFDVDFHSTTPKGVFDSLICACLGCCDPALNPDAFIPGQIVNGLCNPDDHKVCGPQPRPAPANAIIFSGIGTIAPADANGVDGKRAEWVVFRVYIEDRSEPGGFHPKGAVEPADVYCFQAWHTGIQVTKKPDFCALGVGAPGSTLAGVDINEFRTALGNANCTFINGFTAGAGAQPVGSLPSPVVLGKTAEIQDCGPMHSGNHQIHPSTSATCTGPGSACQ